MTRLLALPLCLGLIACGDPSGGDDDDDATCAADDPVLTCPADASFACTGDVTAAMLDAAKVCGDGLSLSDDAPAGGFPVGETTVTYTATGDGVSEMCATTVTITDGRAPEIECPEDGEVVRTAAGEEVTAPEATATDDCTSAVDVSAAPEQLDQGDNTVEYTATDAAGNTGTCEATLTVIDLFAVEGFRVVNAELSGEDTLVTLGWDSTDAADATGYRVERAADPAGPWTPLDTVPVTQVLFTDTLPDTEAYYRVVTVSGDLDGGITDPRRAFEVSAELYDIRDVTVPNIPFATTLYGVVRYPSDLSAGPYPLIVVLHGNHGNCRSSPEGPSDFCSTSEDHECASAGDFTTPNAEGYIYFLETLAAQGYVAVSISGNAMNCRNDFILERSNLIVEHLRRWADWNARTDGPFGGTFVGTLDLSRVGLVGHSRGGDAVSNVPGVLEPAPIAGLTVASIFAVAPTDFHDVTIPEADFAVLLPACDGDVSNLTGMDHYDRSIPLHDGARRAQVFFIGANHNFFNTEWKLSDNGGGFVCNTSAEVGNQAQMGMLETTLGAWFGATLQGDPLEPFIRAEADTPESIDAWAGLDLDLRWSFSAAARTLLDDFEGANTPAENDFGLANALSGVWHELTTRCYSTGCDSRFLHEKGGWKLLWEQGNTPVASWQLGGYDATGHAYLSFRVVSRRSSLNTGLETQDFRIRLYDSGTGLAEFVLSDVKTLRHLYPDHFTREVLETVRIRLDDLLALDPDLDLTSLDLLELEMTALDRSGSVIVTDFEFAD